MRVLVTGGHGFIGRHTIAALRAAGHDAVVLDRHCHGDHEGHEVVLGDVADREVVQETVGRCDAVIHLAGVLGTAETVDDPRPSVITNITGALNVFDACRPRNGRGAIPCVHITVGNWFMRNSYAITKFASEQFAQMYDREHGARIAVVRGLNAYGPGQKAHPVRKIIPNFILRALAGRPIEIYGDGEQVMDMIYVTDVADVLVRAVARDHGAYGQVLEAGTGRPTTVNEIAATVNRIAGNAAGVTHLPMRAGEPERAVVVGDPGTLRPLGIDPARFVTLEDGLARAIDWYRAETRSPFVVA
jgi:UDP-glucose 4-epimerase